MGYVLTRVPHLWFPKEIVFGTPDAEGWYFDWHGFRELVCESSKQIFGNWICFLQFLHTLKYARFQRILNDDISVGMGAKNLAEKVTVVCPQPRLYAPQVAPCLEQGAIAANYAQSVLPFLVQMY